MQNFGKIFDFLRNMKNKIGLILQKNDYITLLFMTLNNNERTKKSVFIYKSYPH